MSTATKSAHTTRPWIVEFGKKFSGENWLVCSVGRSTEDDLEYYVTTDHVHASELSGDAKYDAHLIAAAPDLLEALIQADLQIEYMQSKFKETGTGNAVRAQIAAVIKRATEGL